MKVNLLLPSMLLILLAGCTSPEKLICRNWKVDDISFGPPQNDFEAKIQQTLKEEVPKLGFAFKSDSAYTATSKDGVGKGRWWLIDNKKGVAMIADGYQTNSNILKLTKTKFIFRNKDHQVKFVCSPIQEKK
jgi:hypothetical protein